MTNKQYKNNKSGKVYIVVNMALNATNDRDGELTVIYTLIDTLHSVDRMLFVREVTEFETKFTEVK